MLIMILENYSIFNIIDYPILNLCKNNFRRMLNNFANDSLTNNMNHLYSKIMIIQRI